MSTAAQWYLAAGEKQEGPFTEMDVIARIRSGQAHPETLAYGPGLSEWTALSAVAWFTAAWPRASAATAPAAALAGTPAAGEVPSYSLEQFIRETGERDRPGDVFELESNAMLEVHVNGRTWASSGRWSPTAET